MKISTKIAILIISLLLLQPYSFVEASELSSTEVQLSVIPRRLAVGIYNTVEESLADKDLSEVTILEMLIWNEEDIKARFNDMRLLSLEAAGFKEARIYLFDNDGQRAIIEHNESVDSISGESEDYSAKSFFQEMLATEEDTFLAELEEEKDIVLEESRDLSRRVGSSGQVSYQRDGQLKRGFFAEANPFNWYIVVEVSEEELE